MAQLAAGLAHQLRNSLTGARMSVQLHLPNAIRPQPATRRLPSPCVSSRLPKSKSRDCFRPDASSEVRPNCCDLRQLLARCGGIWWIRRASMRKVVLFQPHLDEADSARALRRPVEPARGGLEPDVERDRGGGAGGDREPGGLSREPAKCSIEVVDSGPGPPPELADDLYEPFVTSKTRGSGAWPGTRTPGRPRPRRAALLDPNRRGHALSALTLPKANGTYKGTRMSQILIVDDEASICWAFRESLARPGTSRRSRRYRRGRAADCRQQIRSRRCRARRPAPGNGWTDGDAFFPRAHRARPRSSSSRLSATSRPRCGRSREGLSIIWSSPSTSTRRQPSSNARSRNDKTAWRPRALRHRETETLIGSSPADARAVQEHRPGRSDRRARADHGRKRDRQGAGRPRNPSSQRPPRRPFLAGQSGGTQPQPGRERTVRARKGSFTGAVQDRKGLLELASGGTVLLDEIGDVSPSLQVKLLRAIEHREVTPVGDARTRFTDIRVIAATNRPLGSLMAAGEFREDLFFRLSVFQIHVPPLRERRDDIPALADHFLRQAPLANVAAAPLASEVLNELRTSSLDGQCPRIA